MLRLCSRASHWFLGLELAFEVDLDFLAVPHWDGEGDGFEAGDEVEGAFFWDGVEALRRVGGDGQGAVGFCDADGFVIRLGDCFGGAGDDREDELQGCLRRCVCACDDFDGRLGEVVGQLIAGFGGGYWLVGRGEETALC